MRAGYRSKCQYQGHERRASGNRIRQQGHGNVSGGQSLCHDSRTDDRGHKKGGSEKFRHDPRAQIRFHCFPIRSTSVWIASLSRLSRGKESKRLILRSRSRKASRKARSICSAVPFTSAGSATPQCAVIGCPGQIGHTSLAALSQTVKTKFIFGAPGFANSSQFLLRKPPAGKPAISICLSASGRTIPEA